MDNVRPGQSAVRLISSIEDTNQNGISDAWEILYFGNLTHSGNADTDGDGLTDIQEYTKGTSPTNQNEDGDLFTDFADLYPFDFYNSEAPLVTIISGNNQAANHGEFNANPFEVAVWDAAGTTPLVNAPTVFEVVEGGGGLDETQTTGAAQILDGTTDIDGVSSSYYRHGSSPWVQSHIRFTAGLTSVSLYSASLDPLDLDADGLLDTWEVMHFANLSATTVGDADGDGLSNLAEFLAGTNPNSAATVVSAATVSLVVFSP